MSYEECRQLVEAAAAKYNVEAAVICAIIEHESGWQNVRNHAGYPAYGLMQVVSSEVIAGRPSGEELLDPATNIEWGTRILAGCLKGRDLEHAMYYYSGGSYWGSYEAYVTGYWRSLATLIEKWRAKLAAEASSIVTPNAATGVDFGTYPHARTRAGVHLGANASFPLGENYGAIVAEYRGRPVYAGFLQTCRDLDARGLTVVKVLTNDDSALNCLPTILYAGLMPVLRIYFERPYIVDYSQKQLDTLTVYRELGGWYVEDDNERNLEVEWPKGQWPGDAMPYGELVAAWARRGWEVVNRGLYFAVPALSPGGNVDDIVFLTTWLRAAMANESAWKLLQSGKVWVSVHAAALTHPLDYPYDEANQREHPGQTLYTHFYADGSPTGASNCWHKWMAVFALVKDITGLELPIIITEGGAWPGKYDDDTRYGALSIEEASRRQYQMLREMETAPKYVIGNCPWLLANRWYGNPNGAFENEAWFRVPGVGNCPVGQPATLPIWDMLAANPCREAAPTDDAGEDKMLTEAQKATVRNLAWNKRGFAYNASFALAKAAAAADAGAPIGAEEDVVIDGTKYRWQFFTDGIAIAPVGKWDEAEVVSWGEEVTA